MDLPLLGVKKGVLLIFLALCAVVSGVEGEPARVLVLHSYHQGFRWTDSVQRGIESAFEEAGQDVELCVEYLDAKRYLGSLLFDRLAEVYAVKYKEHRPDVILSFDDDALRFLFSYREKLFPHVPVFFGGLDAEDFDASMLEGRSGYTGVVERLDLASTIDLIYRLQPDVERIVFVHDRTTSGLAHRKAIEELDEEYNGGGGICVSGYRAGAQCGGIDCISGGIGAAECGVFSELFSGSE